MIFAFVTLVLVTAASKYDFLILFGGFLVKNLRKLRKRKRFGNSCILTDFWVLSALMMDTGYKTFCLSLSGLTR